jgi:hypothetical protein
VASVIRSTSCNLVLIRWPMVRSCGKVSKALVRWKSSGSLIVVSVRRARSSLKVLFDVRVLELDVQAGCNAMGDDACFVAEVRRPRIAPQACWKQQAHSIGSAQAQVQVVDQQGVNPQRVYRHSRSSESVKFNTPEFDELRPLA